MAKPVKIACIGEVMIELIAGQDGQANIGVAGDSYNTAVYLTKLSDDAEIEVSYVTALGTDSFSKRIVSQIKAFGIHTSHIEFREGLMPGLYAIETDETGERSFSYWRGQAAAKTLFQEPCNVTFTGLFDFDWLYVSGISMAILPQETRLSLIPFLKAFRKEGGKLAFDSNYRPKLWEDVKTAREITMAMWAMSDIALPTLDDELALFGDANEAAVIERLLNAGVTFGALKRGACGPFALGKNVGKKNFNAIGNVIDTTAAGDSFNAGFIYHCAIGDSIENAMLGGHRLASKVIQDKGAIIDIK